MLIGVVLWLYVASNEEIDVWSWMVGFRADRLLDSVKREFFNLGEPIRLFFTLVFSSIFLLNGCATLRESIILGASSGAVLGSVAGSQLEGNKEENLIKGAVIGGVIFGLASYAIHGLLEKRDSNVRRETLMNLEKYDVLGFEGIGLSNSAPNSGKCFVSKDVDGRVVSIPCSLVSEPDGVNE